jgi:predicted hydrolase (HD superfamily)
MTMTTSTLRIDQAHALAKELLAEDETRWRHTVGVAARAEEIAVTVPLQDREVLVAAAWLHDIGYASGLVRTGFHPLDAADHLDTEGWPDRISGLVAYHSGADFVAEFTGFTQALKRYPHETSPVSDALAYADQTTGPLGERVDVPTRLAESRHRHGESSPLGQAFHLRAPYLLQVAERVETRLLTASR